MLQITVTRETDEDLVSIGEVVIDKFAGTEMRGGYPPLSVAPPLPRRK